MQTRRTIALVMMIMIVYLYLRSPERRRVFWIQFAEAVAGRVAAGDDLDLGGG